MAVGPWNDIGEDECCRLPSGFDTLKGFAFTPCKTFIANDLSATLYIDEFIGHTFGRFKKGGMAIVD